MIAKMRYFLVLMLSVMSINGFAQSDYPNQPIRLIAGYPPAGNIDIIARIMAEEMSKNLKQPIVVENRAGASGQIAAASVARARPDGYTIFLGASPELAIAKSLHRPLNYDPTTDFQPVSLASVIYFGLAIPNGLPPKNIVEFIEDAKQKPGKWNFASFGLGTSNHLFGELFNNITGTKIQHVPYKGSSFAIPELMAGSVQMMFENIGVFLPHVKAGKLRLLAVTSDERLPLVPDVPTLKESGYPGLVGGTWSGFVVPKGVPQNIIDRLNQAIRSAAQSPSVKNQLASKGISITTTSPEEFGQFINKEVRRWEDAASAAGIKMD